MWLSVIVLLIPGFAASPYEAWFKGEGRVGSRTHQYTVVLRQEAIPLYIGSLRPAPVELPGQTFPGYREVFRAQYSGADTSFWFHRQGYYRAADSSLLWQSTTRAGSDFHEWTRLIPVGDSTQLQYQTPLYGQGMHTYPRAGVLPEEALLWVAQRLLRGSIGEWYGEVLQPTWETGYVRGVRPIRGNLTEDRRIQDDVALRVVRFQSADGKSAEYWLSPATGHVYRFSTFQGSWFIRFQ